VGDEKRRWSGRNKLGRSVFHPVSGNSHALSSKVRQPALTGLLVWNIRNVGLFCLEKQDTQNWSVTLTFVSLA
jgi:hypothetical protein